MEAIAQPGTQEPVDQARAFPWVTVALLVLSVACTGLWKAYPEEAGRWLYASDVEFWDGEKLWSLFTSLFLHVDLMHLVFNCCWVWHLGRVLEEEVSRPAYVAVILVTTLFGSLAEFAVSAQTGAGMSGMLYGLFGYMLVERGRHPVFRRVIYPHTIILLLGWLVLCFELEHSGVMSVANLAHLGGLVSGVLCGFATSGRKFRNAALAGLCGMFFGGVVPLFWAPWHDHWHYVQALDALKRNDQAKAQAYLEYYHQRQPRHAWTAWVAADLRIQQKDYETAAQILTTNMKWTDDAAVANSLAWLLATCPEERVRNGGRAVEIATQACEFTHWENAAIVDTLAAAYAEIGDFDAAMKWSAKAIKLSDDSDRESLRKHLEAFEKKQPVRED